MPAGIEYEYTVADGGFEFDMRHIVRSHALTLPSVLGAEVTFVTREYDGQRPPSSVDPQAPTASASSDLDGVVDLQEFEVSFRTESGTTTIEFELGRSGEHGLFFDRFDFNVGHY